VVSAPTRQLGPNARAVVRARIEGGKRKKLAGLLALFIDAGNRSPSITQLAAASKFDRETTVRVIESLEDDGLVAVDRRGCGTRPSPRRAAYTLILPGIPKQKEQKMNAATTTAPVPVLPEVPTGWSSGWLRPLVSIDWPEYESLRERHERAVAALEAAAGDRALEIEALRETAEIVELAARVLPPAIDENGAGFVALEARRVELQPPPTSDGGHPLAQGTTMAEARAAADLIGSIKAMDGADKRQLILDFRQDYFWLSELSHHGAGSKLSSANAFVGLVRRKCSEAVAEDA
jgi:hypothetical protein